MDLSSQDYERMLDLAVALLESTQPELEWPLLAAELNDALHGVLCLFVGDMKPSRSVGHVQAWAPEGPSRHELDALVRQTIGDHPLAVYYAAHNHDRSPLAMTDVIARADWRRTRAYAVLRSQMGVDHQIALPMGFTRSFLICRPPAEQITDRDLSYARRVQPLLFAAEKQLLHMRHWRASFGLPPPAGRITQLGITPRELSVLTLVAKGLTGTAIGHRLGISPRTVTKHQERLYRKLQVSDRVTAVLRAQAWGLLPVAADDQPATTPPTAPRDY